MNQLTMIQSADLLLFSSTAPKLILQFLKKSKVKYLVIFFSFWLLPLFRKYSIEFKILNYWTVFWKWQDERWCTYTILLQSRTSIITIIFSRKDSIKHMSV